MPSFLATQTTHAKVTVLETDTELWIPCGCLHTYEKKIINISSDAPALGAVPRVVPTASKGDKYVLQETEVETHKVC